MKAINKIAIVMCLLKGLTVSAQEYPFLTDPGSLGGSVGAYYLYRSLLSNEKNLTSEINRYRNKYYERLAYLTGPAAAGALYVNDKLDEEISNARKRYNTLTNRNSTMAFFNYTKKKRNTKNLATAKQMIDNLQGELNNNSSLIILYGDRLNLYQNAMESIFNIHRLLDMIEDSVEQSALIDFITRRK
ncbi:hypothetical protein M0D21_06375 [Aquimarina sp. D1M17]|uniref:hypothetical protein n=1 Tax=Aquimarina acroporae TaxID=2937283 RepID=UPI0020C1876F|nr:hypothetical protein [Aquimarina acroporae]MCK8521183.1 hypothetical protein [Aquimarina acroporae]